MKSQSSKDETTHRISVTFTQEQYEFLERTASRKRVSIAWVIRDAVEKLVVNETPLFPVEDR